MSNRPRLPNNLIIPKDAKEVFSGVIYKIYQWQQKQFDGSFATYEAARRKDTVIVIPVIGEEVVLINERQPHFKESGLNILAGKIEDEEDLKMSAKRETEEETGMVFENFYLVDVERPLTSVEWYLYTFVATSLKTVGEKKLEPGEQIEVVKVGFEEFGRLIQERKFFHRARMAENYIVKNEFDRFFDVLRRPEKHEIKY